MVRILENSSKEEELNELELFNLKKRRLNRRYDSYLIGRKEVYFVNISDDKTGSNGQFMADFWFNCK